MQVGQSNQIYLENYNQDGIWAPFYSFVNNEQFNLTLIQSVQEIFNNQSTLSNILCISNYVLELGSASNVFWVLTNQLQLYTGIINEIGEVKMSSINVQIPATSCYNINLINYNYGILSCETSGMLSFITINASSTQIESYKTSLKPSSIKLQTFISINQANNYTINVANINQNSTQILTYFFISNSLSLNNTLTLNGAISQMYASNNFDYFFLLSQNSIILVNNIMNMTNTLLNFSNNQVQQFSIFEMSNNLFRLSLLNSQFIQLYLVYTNVHLCSFQSQILIQQPSNISLFNMNYRNIYLIAANLIAVINIPNDMFKETQTLSIFSYLNINQSIQSAIINQDRSLLVIFSTTQIQTYFFTNPFIQITQSQSNQISAQGQFYQLNISVISQITQLQPYYLILNITTVDYQISQCPITTQVDQSILYIEYPTYTTIPQFNIYQGPFLSTTIQSNNSNYVQVYTNNYESAQSNYNFTQQNYQVLCAFQYTIPIYCTQYQNSSIVISQWFSTQTIVINPQNNQNLTSCKCFVQDLEVIQVVMQFQQQIIVQQLLPFFMLGYEQTINFNQQVISIGILKNSLFVITQDNQLSSYDLNNNNTLQFNYSGQQFQNIYINEISYPNYLFIDNTTNLVILSYHGQNTYELVNEISFPITNYNSSTFGILKDGIYLALLLNSTSEIYFYPKSNIFVQNQIQLYYQVSLFGYNIYGPQILSSFTDNYFYLVTVTSNNTCCQVYSLQATGSAFNAPNFLQNLQVSSITTFNAATKFSADTDVVQYYQASQSLQKSFNFTVSIQESFIFIPFYVSPNLYYATTNISYINSNCSLQVQQNVTIVYQQQMISPLDTNNVNYAINQSTNIIIDPSTLFSGNIESISVVCQNCTQFIYQTPITQLRYALNISYQAALQYRGYLMVQDNNSVYVVYQDQTYYQYSLPGQNQICSYMFVEMVSGLLMSLCYSGNLTYLYTYNETSTQNTSIQQSVSIIGIFSQASYANGVLQIISKNSLSTFNYAAYYIWIINNSINLSEVIQQQDLLSSENFEFISLYQSQNFTSEPCQIFGLTAQQQLISSASVPMFYILKSCMSSKLSKTFGFEGNNYTNNTVEYFINQSWNLYSTQPPFQTLVGSIIQYGTTMLVAQDLIEAQFVVPYEQIAYKYFVLFNSSNGNITGYWEANSFFISSQSSFNEYQMFYSIDGPLINVEGQNNKSTVNVCVYPNTNNFKNDNQIIYNIGCMQFNGFDQSLNKGSVGNYFLMTNKSNSLTVVYEVYDQISIYVDSTGYNTSSIVIIAGNQFGSSEQFINITNYYIAPNKNDSSNTNNTPQNDDNSKQSHLGMILGIVFGVLILIAVIIFLIWHFKKKEQEQQQQNQPLFELK